MHEPQMYHNEQELSHLFMPMQMRLQSCSSAVRSCEGDRWGGETLVQVMASPPTMLTTRVRATMIAQVTMTATAIALATAMAKGKTAPMLATMRGKALVIGRATGVMTTHIVGGDLETGEQWAPSGYGALRRRAITRLARGPKRSWRWKRP